MDKICVLNFGMKFNMLTIRTLKVVSGDTTPMSFKQVMVAENMMPKVNSVEKELTKMY